MRVHPPPGGAPRRTGTTSCATSACRRPTWWCCTCWRGPGSPAATSPGSVRDVLEAVVDVLACPHCARSLSLDSGTARCPTGHAFDVARQGYLNLLPRPAPNAGDTAAMVAARTDFLASGNYEPICRALIGACSGEGLVVEVGAGTGDYLAGVVAAGPRRGLALDVSAYAARRAAKAHERIGAVVCDAWQRLPVRDGVA